MASVVFRNGSYRITVSCGYTDNGKKLREEMTWTPTEGLSPKQTEKKLDQIAHEFEKKVKNGTYLDGEKISLAEFSERWLRDYAEKQLKAKSVDWYRTMLNERILPAIGHIKIAKIQPHNLIQFMSDLNTKGAYRDIKYIAKPGLEERIRCSQLSGPTIGIHPNTLRNAKIGHMVSPETAKRIAKGLRLKVTDLFNASGSDKTLSAQTVTHHLRCISSILSTAVEWQVIVSNPCERVKSPRQDKKKIHFLEINEVQTLLDAALLLEDIRVQTAVLIFLFTGIRKGELAALEWQDIDFEEQTMTIERNMQYIRGHGLVTASTKTESGERFISISTSLNNQLKKYRIWQNEEKLKTGSIWVDRNRLFTRWNGDYIAPSTVYHWVKTFLIEQGHAEMTVHGLRHTNISVLLSQGVDLITASRRAGHSRPSTTANIYAHALRRPDEKAADVLEDVLSRSNTVSM